MENNNYNIYKIETKERIDRKKLAIVILIIVIWFCLIFIGKNAIEIMKNYKVYKQYEEQLTILNEQDIAKKAEIEKEQERIRLERIPKLTRRAEERI